jgi:glycosyltransferase involved in cell wall biosynthesis
MTTGSSWSTRERDPVRLLRWSVRVVAAAVRGAAIRFARRIARRPPRIWHGPQPLHAIRYMVAADRLAGYPSRSVVLTEKQVKYDLVTRSDFDVVVRSETVPWHDLHWLALIDLLLRGDVWVTYFDGLFFNVADRRKNELAFRLIRIAGIRIVVTAHGSDVIRLDVPPTRYDWIARMQKDYPSWDFAAQTPISKTRLDHFCRHSDLVLPGDPIMARLVPRNDLLIKVYPIDTDELQPVEMAPHAGVKIVHAPNHRNVKGTDFLMAAVEALTAKGFACELVLIERVARSEALRRYAEADIIADQFCMGGWAQFAMEGMALGKPVLAYLDREHLESPQFNLPVVNATPENLAAVLAVLIELEELRRRLGAASRAAVERYQSVPALGEVWDRIYRHVWWRRPLDFTGTAHFSPERTRRALTEDPAVEEFWPVAVDDLMVQIAAAAARMR